jgi:hypothetical protein
VSAARALAALGALAGLVGLGLQFWIMLGTMDPALATWRFFAYFTILTNTFVTLVLARAALKPGADGGLNAPHVELMAVTSILFVCIVYNLLLRARWDPQGWQLVADVLVHQIVPILCSLYWLARPHGRLVWRDAGFAALWPLGYAIYGLTRGAFDGFYPYFFMDPTSASYAQIALNLVGLVVAFLIGASIIIAIDHTLARRALSSSAGGA